jgi:hypothetical protein
MSPISPITGAEVQVELLHAGCSLIHDTCGEWVADTHTGRFVAEIPDKFKILNRYPVNEGHESLQIALRHILCSYVARAKLLKQPRPYFTESGETTTNLNFPVDIQKPSQLLQRSYSTTLEEKASQSLRNLAMFCGEIGGTFNVAVSYADSSYYNLIFAPTHGVTGDLALKSHLIYGTTRSECNAIFSYLEKKGFISRIENKAVGPWSHFRITIPGYESMARTAATADGFIVCKFDNKEVDSAIRFFIGVAGDIGVTLKPVSDHPHNEQITDEIHNLIRKSSVVVCDLTKSNFNVGYEAGFAIGLGKPVIYTAKRQKNLKFPFDVQCQNVLLWDPNDLPSAAEKFKQRLIAALRMY